MTDATLHMTLPNGVEDRKARDTSRSITSLVIATAVIVIAFLFPIIQDYLTPEPEQDQITVQAKKVINYSQLSAPPPIDLEKPEPETFKVPPKAKQVKFIQPVAKKDEEVTEEEYIPTMDEMDQVQIGTVASEGIDSVIVDVEVAVEAPVEEAVLSFVEVMPSFKGGDAELMKYLGENLSYPSMGKDLNIQGVVYVRFVVERDGTIGDVTVLRGVFGALDEEAVRVIKAMPPWVPGQQNGRKVRVYYTIPIRFELR